MRKAVILLSGGLDSTTCLALAKDQGFHCYALSFDFGQKHRVELESAIKIAKQMGVIQHKIIELNLDSIKGSSLTDPEITIPDYDPTNIKIPSTYVPARNTIFLSIALGWAEVLASFDIFYGANDVDYSGYPDCRPAYIQAFEKLANLATKASTEEEGKFTIHAPLISMSKDEIIKVGLRLGVDYSLTISCYRANSAGRSCSKCDSCTYRKLGFEKAGVLDPTLYV